MSLKLFKYIPIIIYLSFFLFYSGKNYIMHPSCGGILPMKMTDLVVQCTYTGRGVGKGEIIILWIGTPGVELRIPSDGYD